MKAIRIAVPLLTLALFYGGLVWFTVRKTREYSSPRPQLTVAQSRAILLTSKRLIAEGHYHRALGPSLTLLEAYPENGLYIAQVAQIEERVGDYKDAARHWDEYMNYSPVPESACPAVGNDYWKLGEEGHEEALQAFKRCLKLAPADPDYVFYYAHALEMSGYYSQAARWYQKGLQISPHYPDIRLGLARVMIHQGQYSQAQQIASDVLQKSPQDVDALLVMGLATMKQGQLKQANQYFSEGAKLSPAYADFHMELAHIAEEQNDNAEAIRQYQDVMKLEPGNEAVRTHLANLMKENHH